MEVISQSGGSLCICFQHPVKRHSVAPPKKDRHTCHSSFCSPPNKDTVSPHKDSKHSTHGAKKGAVTPNKDMVDVSYSVLVVHHMRIVYGSALQVPLDMAVDTKLYFSPLGKCVL